MKAGVARRAPQRTVLAQVREERRRQDKQWGGPSHDDAHVPSDWVSYVGEHLDRAKKSIVQRVLADPDRYRQNMIEVAALAVAAVESLDRKRKRR